MTTLTSRDAPKMMTKQVKIELRLESVSYTEKEESYRFSLVLQSLIWNSKKETMILMLFETDIVSLGSVKSKLCQVFDIFT